MRLAKAKEKAAKEAKVKTQGGAMYVASRATSAETADLPKLQNSEPKV